MQTLYQHILHRITPYIPGWLFLFAGISLVAMAVLTPAWLQSRQLKHQQQIMSLRADRIEQQRTAYKQFLTALEAENPVILERLAMDRLLLKPQGSTVIDPHLSVLTTSLPSTNTPISHISIAQWLHRPLPQSGIDYKPLPPIQTYLTRITTGPARIILIAFALALIVFSLYLPSPQALRSNSDGVTGAKS